MTTLLRSTLQKVAETSVLLLCLSANPVFADSADVAVTKIADFSAKITSVTYLDDRTTVNMQTNGEVGPFGTVGLSATFMHPIDAKGTTGQYRANARAFRPDGSIVDGKVQGVWKSLGKHRWEVKTIGINTEGRRTFSAGVLELATMSFNGTVYSLD